MEDTQTEEKPVVAEPAAKQAPKPAEEKTEATKSETSAEKVEVESPKTGPKGKEEITPQQSKEEVPKTEAKSEAPAPQQQPQGGWGWGSSWWNAASSVVTSSVSAISDTVREMVIDEPEQRQAPQLYRKEEPKPEGQQQANGEDMDLLSVVDKGFTMLGDGVDKLGSFLGHGISKVAETANLKPEDIQNMAVNSYNMAKQVASDTTQVASNFGEKFANQSVDALESVGKKALGFLTVEEEVQNKKRIRPVFQYVPQVTQMTKEEQETFQDLLNKNYFDENNGTAHLQELEKLSIECTLKYQKVEQKLVKLDAQHREEVVELLNKVKELFDEEDEDKKLEVTEVELNEPANKHKETVDNLAKSAHAKASEMVEAFKAELRELKPEGVEPIVSSTDICHLTASYMDKTLLESVKFLSQFSASSVEQLLRIVESYLIDADLVDSKTENAETEKKTVKMSKDEFIKRIAFAYSVTSMLSEELNTLGTEFIDAMKQLSEAGKSNFAELAKKGEAEEAESQKCTEDIDSKFSLHETEILNDTSNAIANIEECRKFLFPISKSLITATITLPEESQK